MGLSNEQLHTQVLYPVTRVRTGNAGGSGVLIYSKEDVHNPGEHVSIVLTCVPGPTRVNTREGNRRIDSIQVGDYVLTHKNKYRKVTTVMSRLYDGGMIEIGVSGSGSKTGAYAKPLLKVTPEHPILVQRGKTTRWVEAQQVRRGDVIFSNSKRCVCGQIMPYFRKFCNTCKSNMQAQHAKKVTAARWEDHVKQPPRHLEWAGARKHSPYWTFTRHIAPVIEEMQSQGFRCVPIGHYGVVPDFLALKDDKVFAVEVEHNRNTYSTPAKYIGEPGKWYDDIIWVNRYLQSNQGLPYAVDDETGLIALEVRHVSKYQTERSKHVYNLEVEEDNSYVAGGIVVHNCHHVVSGAIKLRDEWDPVLKRQRKMDYTEEVSVEVFDYRGSKLISSNSTQADVIAWDEYHDLAALKLHNPTPMKHIANIIPRKDIPDLCLFDPCLTSGCSLLHDPFANPGTLTYLREIIEQKAYIMSNSPGIFGNSGGGLFHGDSGNLLGLVSRVTTLQLGFGVDVLPFMLFSTHPERLYEFFDYQELQFLYDPKDSYHDSMKRRSKRQKEALRGLLLDSPDDVQSRVSESESPLD